MLVLGLLAFVVFGFNYLRACGFIVLFVLVVCCLCSWFTVYFGCVCCGFSGLLYLLCVIAFGDVVERWLLRAFFCLLSCFCLLGVYCLNSACLFVLLLVLLITCAVCLGWVLSCAVVCDFWLVACLVVCLGICVVVSCMVLICAFGLLVGLGGLYACVVLFAV